MFLLVVALGAVVYTIVSPPHGAHKKIAAAKLRKPAPKAVADKSQAGYPAAKQTSPVQRVVATAEKPVEKIVAKQQEPQSIFSGKLELQVHDVAAADAYITRAMEDNGLVAQAGPAGANRKIYSIDCAPETLKSFLDQLKGIWNRFDSTRLSVDGVPVVVDDVTADQITGIVGIDSLQQRVKAAQSFAALNNMNRHLPGKEVMTVVNDRPEDLANIPKPVLTAREKARESAAGPDGQKVRLTIVITLAN